MSFAFFVVMGLVFFTLWLFVMVTSQVADDRFSKRWPPINDDEFLRRCPPGTNRNTALTVRRIMSESTGIPYESIYPEQHMVSDLGMD